MSKNKLVHRALYLENILVKYIDEEKTNYIFKLKLTDDSIIIDNINEKKIKKINIFTNFTSPEILKGEQYNINSDLWSLGVIIYSLYFGKYPYDEDGQIKMLKYINNLEGNLEKTNDKDLDDLIEKLLTKDPNERLTWSQYFNHSFFKKNQKLVNKNYYDIGDKIGTTNFAIVYKASIKGSNEKRAIKIYDKNKIKNHIKKTLLKMPEEKDMKPYIDDIFREIKNMQIIEGKNKENNNTVKFYEYYEKEDEIGVIMELCDENLLNLLTRKKESFNLDSIYNILNQLNKSFNIMSKNKLIHRALNLDNILVKYLNEEKTKYTIKLKLTENSGLIDDKIENLKFQKINENKYFIAPEILNKEEYNEKSDLWSLGIIIYVLYFRNYPYEGDTDIEILNEIKNIGQNLNKTSDPNLNDLIKNLLNINVKERYNWNQYFNHPFFKK